MSRMSAEARREELLEIAFHQFITNGYEKTSIRSIVGEAGGEIGMFYHHFFSKDDIFRVVLEEYNKRYVTEVNAIIAEHKKRTFWEVIDLIFCDLAKSLTEYSQINGNNRDERVLQLLHQSTLTELVPCFCKFMEDYIKRGEVAVPDVEVETLVNFMLYGVSAVVHKKDNKNINQKYVEIKELLQKLLRN